MLLNDRKRLLKIDDYCSQVQKTIERYGNSMETFMADIDYQQSVSFSILQIGEIANGLSEDFKKSTYDRIPWRQVRGMRNVVVHGYGNINVKTLWKTATEDIPELGKLCREELEQKNA